MGVSPTKSLGILECFLTVFGETGAKYRALPVFLRLRHACFLSGPCAADLLWTAAMTRFEIIIGPSGDLWRCSQECLLPGLYTSRPACGLWLEEA